MRQHPHVDVAALAVVPDGVLHQVAHQLVEQPRVAPDDVAHALHVKRHAHAGRLGGESSLNVVRHGQEVDLLVGAKEGGAVPGTLGLVKLGEHEYVAHQAGEAPRVVVYAAGKALHVLRAADAVADELRGARDAGDGRLELVGDVGRELSAHVVGVLDGAHALKELAALLVQTAHQGLQLLVGGAGVRPGGVDLKDGPHEATHQQARDAPARGHHAHRHHDEKHQVAREEGSRAGPVHRDAQHVARAEPAGLVEAHVAHGLARALRGARPRGEGA